MKCNELWDFIFEGAPDTDLEGEQVLCEARTLDEAWSIMINDYGFGKDEIICSGCVTVEEGEMLGLDTY